MKSKKIKLGSDGKFEIDMSLEKNLESELIKCKNCFTEFKGKYCPECGQSIYEYDKPISILIVDFLGNVIAFDTRFWKTFIALIFRPGLFTLEYLKGHRVRFAPPFRVYLFISLAFFLLLSSYINNNLNVTEENRIDFNSAIERKIESDTSSTDSLIESRYNIKLSGAPEDQIELLGALKKIIANPGMYINSFLRVFSWSLFLLMPVYGAILWLLFWKAKPYYYGHLVFSVNQHAFIFLLFSFLFVIKLLFPDKGHNYENFLGFIFPIYLYIGALRLYANSKTRTFFKMLLAWILYLFIVTFSVSIIIIIWYWMEFL